MRKALISVIDEQISNPQIKHLEALLKRNYAAHVSNEKLTVIWCKLPANQVYTNYKLSRTSVVSVECTNNFPQQQRVAFLESVAAEWATVTSQHPDELMLALVEEDLFKTVIESNQQRLSPKGNRRLKLKLVTRLLGSKLRNGFLSFNPNL